MSNELNPAPVPVVIGVTGHCDMISCEEIESSVRGLLCAMRQIQTTPLYVMTALADGADQLVAKIADDLGIDLIAVLPQRLEEYKATVRDISTFEKYWKKAKLHIELPGEPAAGKSWQWPEKEARLQQLGAFIARHSHLLLALWEGPDGGPMPDESAKPGGTSDVIRLRMDVGHAMDVEDRSKLFDGSSSSLDITRAIPLVYVCTPRVSKFGANPSSLPDNTGYCYMLTDVAAGDIRGPTWRWDLVPDATNIWAEFGKEVLTAFAYLRKMNEQIATLRGSSDAAIFDARLKNLRIPKLIPGPQKKLDFLTCMQASADTISSSYQQKLIGQFSALPFSVLWRRVLLEIWRKNRSCFPNALNGFSIVLPLSVLLFEAHSKLGLGWGYLLLYLLISACTVGIYHLCVKDQRWQDQWQDYRALAEAIRVQMFWALSALPIAAADNYLRKQDGELGWIRFALQGPAIWASSLALEIGEPNRGAVMDGWIRGQADYFVGTDGVGGKALQNREAAERNDAWTFRLYILGLIFACVVLVVEFLHNNSHGAGGCFFKFIEMLHNIESYLDVAAVFFPAVAAVFAISTDLRAYEAHSHNYRQMGNLFRRAMSVLALPDTDAAKFQDIIRELGREALAENAEWLMDHRDRRIKPNH